MLPCFFQRAFTIRYLQNNVCLTSAFFVREGGLLAYFLFLLLLNCLELFQNEEAPVPRICYASMKHVEGDVVRPRDCILLASGNRKRDLPFVAKVTALWENPDDGK